MKAYTPRSRCGARKRDGGSCQNGSGARTDHPGTGPCWLHTGSTKNARKNGQRLAAEAAAERLGLPLATSAADALQAGLERTNGIVAWLLAQLAALEPGDLTWGATQRRLRPGQDGGAAVVEVIHSREVHPLFTLYAEAEQRLTRIAAEMSRLGIEQRQQALLEMIGSRLADGLDRALADAGIPLGQRARVLQLLPGALDSTDGYD
jgi:hypothetical protein